MKTTQQIEAAQIMKADKPSKLIASIPHGASLITEEMKQQIHEEVLLTNNDWALKEMYQFLPALGVSTICANYSRYMADVNRCLVSNQPEGDYTQAVVYQFSTFGDALYPEPLARSVIEQRIEDFYMPYHRDLEALVHESKGVHQRIFLCDLHSFDMQTTSDIVLGTRGMTSCSPAFFELVKVAFCEEGFSVEVDVDGLRGGYITRRYSEMAHVEALQIEMRYSTYLEPREFGKEEVHAYDEELFCQTQQRLKNVFSKIRVGVEAL